MRVRALSETGDFTFGSGIGNYLIETPDAVGQIVGTRMALWEGQWFLNVADGMTWATKVLGKYTGSERDPAIRNRILTTPGVEQISRYGSQADSETREFHVQAEIDTIYGIVKLAGPV